MSIKSQTVFYIRPKQSEQTANIKLSEAIVISKLEAHASRSISEPTAALTKSSSAPSISISLASPSLPARRARSASSRMDG